MANIFRQNFDSFADFMDWLRDTPRVWSYNKSEHTNDPVWFGTANYEEAQELARYGWKEGRDKLDQSVRNAAHSVSYKAGPARTMDVGGAYPIVPLACAGDPLNMVHIGEDKRAQRPTARFLVSLSISGSVGPDVIRTRGAAILSWIDALEAEGIRCEVAIHLGSRGSKNHYVETQTIVKRAQDPLDIDRMAYVLLHPSMLRRHLFALIERSTKGHQWAIGSGYGMPCDAQQRDPDQIYFGRMLSDGSGTWSNVETASAHVRKQIKNAGVFVPPSDEMQDAA